MRRCNRGAVLVTGGAGYIGSHTVLALRDAGRQVAVLDDLSTGMADAVPEDVPLVVGDVADQEILREVIAEYEITSAIHFAGSILVPESVVEPLKYYRNNTAASRSLVESCIACGVDRLIFSSSAAVYGDPSVLPVDESSPTLPINPYGTSKLMSEQIIRDAARAHGLSYLVLRYFNVAGADPLGRSGQNTASATHLLKVAAQAAVGLRDGIQIFGDDYDTPDGTCIRDYVHVTDLAHAHVRALEHLEGGGPSLTLNCGYGRGYSVREVLAAVEREAGRPLEATVAPRRPGDPPRLVAEASRIRNELAWRPRHDDLGEIVRTALAWEKKLAAEQGVAPQAAE